MTPMERTFEIMDRLRDVLIIGGSTARFNDVQEQIAAAIRAAVLAEREECRAAIEEMAAHAQDPDSEELTDQLDHHHPERREILEALGVAFNQVEMAERERCAKIAETWGGPPLNPNGRRAAIAAAIRSGGQL